MLDYDQLQALAAVVDHGGFERAARALHLTQSAVSQRVKALEESLGQALVARGSPPAPTGPGQKLLAHYRKVSLLEHDLGQELSGAGCPGLVTLPVGVNADSLATWFWDAVEPFLRREPVALDLVVDDQDRTHELLCKGEVVGCVTTRAEPSQGCLADRLGTMRYLCVATEEFIERWAPRGLDENEAVRAPAMVFNRKDETHARFLAERFGAAPGFPRFHVPSSEGFVEAIARGLAYGLAPEAQAAPLLASGRLREVSPGAHVNIRLYWRRWALRSPMLEGLSAAVIEGAGRLLRKRRRVGRDATPDESQIVGYRGWARSSCDGWRGDSRRRCSTNRPARPCDSRRRHGGGSSPRETRKPLPPSHRPPTPRRCRSCRTAPAR